MRPAAAPRECEARATAAREHYGNEFEDFVSAPYATLQLFLKRAFYVPPELEKDLETRASGFREELARVEVRARQHVESAVAEANRLKGVEQELKEKAQQQQVCQNKG